MTKQNGLGSALLVGGYDLSGDINAIDNVNGGPAALDVTGINKYAHERIGGLRDGALSVTTFFNPGVAQAHPVFSALPTTDIQVGFLVGTVLGNEAVVEIAKQVGYDPSRGADGSLTTKVATLPNGYGIEWGRQLTAGLRTDTAATNGTGVDFTASTAFGCQAYLQVTAFTGTDVTIKIQDSADNVTFADLASAAFTATTAARTTQRLQTGRTDTTRRYLRVATTTSGGFTSASFSVVVIKNKTTVAF